MECNKDEAMRAKEIAQKKMENNDFEGAQKFAKKAQNIFPELENITQLLTVCDVHCSSQKRILGSEKDWYEILQVERLADELTVKKQYRRLALFLHPDKNRFPGAEAAFKLICEANAVLSDSRKKSLYDSRIRASIRSAPTNPPNHHVNTSQVKNKYRAQNNVSNGFSSLNQHQSSWSSSSVRQEGFWTLCPFCSSKHQYQREFVNQSLRCPKCSKLFIAYEQSAEDVPLGSKQAMHGSRPISSKLGSSQPVTSQGKRVPIQGDFKMGVQDDKRFSESHTDSQGNVSKKTVKQEPGNQSGNGFGGVQTESAVKSSRDKKAKDTDFSHVNSLHGGKEGGTSNGDVFTRESGGLKKKGRKRGRKRVVESSESFDTASESDIEDVVTRENFGDSVKKMDPEPTVIHFPRRSARKRQHVIYNESDDDFASPLKGSLAKKLPDDRGKGQEDALAGEASIHGDQNSFPTDADYSKSKSKQMGTAHTEGGKSKSKQMGTAHAEGGKSKSKLMGTAHTEGGLQDKGSNQDKSKVKGETGGVRGKGQEDTLDGEASIHGDQNIFPTDADYSKSKSKQMGTAHTEGGKSKSKQMGTAHTEGGLQDKGANQDKSKVKGETGGMPGTDADTVKIKSDSDQDSFSSDDSVLDVCDVPEPEFNDFDQNRDENCFAVNQIWACFDSLDGMPRFYAKVKNICKSPFKLSFTWFEADPKDEADKKWVAKNLPVACGSFKVGKTENTSRRLSFSHQMSCESGQKRGSFIIYPKKGETWAIFKDWNISWSLDPEHLSFKYEIVEVLSDFVVGSGIKVGYLDKIRGFLSLFQRTSQSETDSFLIGCSEFYKFSHRVPCFKMTGSEREGVPKGSFELDPASLPLNPDDLYFPGKANMEQRNLDAGVGGSPADLAEKGGSVNL